MPSPIKVLIVEDDNAMAQMCAKLIRRRGHSAVIACSSRDALAIVRMGGDIDVVISDVMMPSMNGIQLMAQLHAIDRELPVILMTGYASSLGPSPAVALGAADYLIKPFDSEALLGSVERAFRMRHPQAAVE
jgi:DNA-binding NtrC family response regulator